MRFNKLGNIISIAKGKKHLLTEKPTESSKRLILIDDLRNNDNIKFTDDKKGTDVTKKDLLIVWDGANAGTIGYNITGFIGSTIARLRINEVGKYYTPFIGKFLQSKFSYLRKTATGATIPHINRKALDSIKIPLLQIEDQVRIAEVLSRVDALIAKRKESIRLLDELLHSTFLDMSGVSAQDYHDWPLLEIQQLAKSKKGSMRTGPFGSSLLHSEFMKEGDVAVLGIDNAVNNKFQWDERRFITQKKYEKLKNYKIYPRDIIITIMGTTGRSAVIPDDIPLAINTKHLASITLDETKANPYFISYAIHSSPYVKAQLKSQNRGAIMSGLNLGIIKKIKIKKPPIKIQNKFEEIMQRVEPIKSKYEESLAELKNLYGSLSQRAFRGDLDLSKVPVVDSVIELEPIELKLSIPEVTVKATKRFSEKELTRILKESTGKPLSFKDLWSKLENSSFEKLPEYDEVKKVIFKMLEGKNPLLSQTFDEENKEIVLRII